MTEQTFTDEDLKKFKELFSGNPHTEIFSALLARLEAAEDYIGALTTGSGIKTKHLFEDAWRQVSGK